MVCFSLSLFFPSDEHGSQQDTSDATDMQSFSAIAGS
jgi:hypothetical protein